MIKVENIDVWGFDHAIRGMRNPLNSWDKSDSYDMDFSEDSNVTFFVGENDMKLMKKLCAAGSEHRKYLRQIMVSMDITAPLYWWKEFDTYKVGTTANSCSTMHKIADKQFTFDDFSIEHLVMDDLKTELTDKSNKPTNIIVTPYGLMNIIIGCLNNYRMMYLKTKNKLFWWQMIQLLPTSYNQKRTVTMNYENVWSMIDQRKNHKLDEWNDFVKILCGLPYMCELKE